MIDDRRFLLAMLGVGVISVLIMPFLLGAEDPILKLRRQQIASMTAAERERLDRNFQRFQQLTEQEREHFRLLHATLEADRHHPRGSLNETLRTYDQWLQTLPHYERETLKSEGDPTKKVALIRQALERQREDEVEIQLGAERGERLGPIPLLSPADFDRVRTELDQMAETMLSANAAAKQTEGYEGLERTLKLLEMLGRQDRRLVQLLNEDRMRRLTEAIADEKARQLLEDFPGSRPPTHAAQKIKLVLTLWTNFERAVERERRTRKITDAMLANALAEFPEGEQEELLELPPSLFRLEMRARIPEGNSPPPIDRRLLRRFFRPNLDHRASRGDNAAPTNEDRSIRQQRTRRRIEQLNEAAED